MKKNLRLNPEYLPLFAHSFILFLFIFQVGFINFICVPLYTTLSTLLPETRALLEGCNTVKEHWEMVTRELFTRRNTLSA